MTPAEIIAIILMTLAFFSRPFGMRAAAREFSSTVNALSISIWAFVIALLIMPFAHSFLYVDGVFFLDNPAIWVPGLIKGATLWGTMQMFQLVRRESISTGEYIRFLGVGMIAVVNFVVLGEELTRGEWLGVVIMTFLGSTFFFRGHLSELSTKTKGGFLGCIGFLALNGMVDYMGLSNGNWYTYFILSTFGMVVTSLVLRFSKEDWRRALMNPLLRRSGLTFAVSEPFLLYPIVTILPVSIAMLIGGVTIPIVMVISALIWGERGWREQAFYGLTGLCAILVMIYA